MTSASRGLNGIDGQISTFLGGATQEGPNWCVLGDLTALYDMPGPWILQQLPGVQANLVIINNSGGKIFDRMFPHPEFQNPHGLSFEPWARMWNLDYERWTRIPADLSRKTTRSRVIEVIPDAEATARFWKNHDSLWNG